jgi:AcrR family transcriptional regulator
MTATAGSRSTRAVATRELILSAAERLFAEQGVFAISNRQVSEAAGQGNNAAVGYHFGTKNDLILAIVNKHSLRIEESRAKVLSEVMGSTDVREWITCLVRPATLHMAELGTPSWYARFNAQVATDPTLRVLAYQETERVSPSLSPMVKGLGQAVAHLPPDIRMARGAMGRLLMTHMCAERELQLASDDTAEAPSWDDFGTDLIDAIAGLWTAPVTR